MKKIIAVTLASLFTASSYAAVLNMRVLAIDEMGNVHQVEEKFWRYGSKQDGYKYKGTRWLVQDPVGRQTMSMDVFFDCSDATMGMQTPTTEDIPSGTILHLMYKEACK